MKTKIDRIILGIDPGTTIMGYGLIFINENKMELINMGVLNLKKLESHEDKLKYIFERTLSLIKEYKPDELAIEAPFYGKNVQSMLKLGRAQGVAISAALYRNIPIYKSLLSFLNLNINIDYCIIGVASAGGVLPPCLNRLCLEKK